MAETVMIRVTATDSDGATDTAEAVITVNAPDAPSTDLPQITSFTADDTTLDPGQVATLTVVGTNYTRVIWESDITLGTHADGELKRTFTAPNVVAGTTYTVRVTLANDHGTDSESLTLTINNVAPIITSLTGIPQAPSFVTVGNTITAAANANDANGDSISYTWSAPLFSQAAGMLNNERDLTAPISITGVNQGKQTIVCTAYDSPPSPYVSMNNSRQQDVIIAGDKPGAPTIDSIDSTQTEITFNWTAPSNNGGSPITGYRVWIRIGDSTTFSRSEELEATVTSYTYDNLAAETDHEVAVEAFNTFEIDGNEYGQTSDRATMSIKTDPLRVAPGPGDPNDHNPNLVPLTPLTTVYEISRIESEQEEITHIMQVEYSDADGDTVAIQWEETISSLDGASLSADAQPDPFAGVTEAQYTIPAGEIGIAGVRCAGTDGRSGETVSLIFSIRVRFES